MKSVSRRFSDVSSMLLRRLRPPSSVSPGDLAKAVESLKTEIILVLVVEELTRTSQSLREMLKDCETCTDCKHKATIEASTASLASTFRRLNRILPG